MELSVLPRPHCPHSYWLENRTFWRDSSSVGRLSPLSTRVGVQWEWTERGHCVATHDPYCPLPSLFITATAMEVSSSEDGVCFISVAWKRLPLCDDHCGGVCWTNFVPTTNFQVSKLPVWRVLQTVTAPTFVSSTLTCGSGLRLVAAVADKQSSCYLGLADSSECRAAQRHLVSACPLWMMLFLPLLQASGWSANWKPTKGRQRGPQWRIRPL